MFGNKLDWQLSFWLLTQKDRGQSIWEALLNTLSVVLYSNLELHKFSHLDFALFPTVHPFCRHHPQSKLWLCFMSSYKPECVRNTSVMLLKPSEVVYEVPLIIVLIIRRRKRWIPLQLSAASRIPLCCFSVLSWLCLLAAFLFRTWSRVIWLWMKTVSSRWEIDPLS